MKLFVLPGGAVPCGTEPWPNGKKAAGCWAVVFAVDLDENNWLLVCWRKDRPQNLQF